ncbi:MAG: lipopolysaccharide biosynthesis protein [Sulfurovum sp.]|nr:MAG: lipopolysaccharide biosynthesis protein [Sulfurovum sp.]
MSQNTFRKNIITLMMGTTIAQALPLAFMPIITRLYTPNDFGVFAIFVALATILGAIATARYEMAILLPKKEIDAINISALSFLILTLFSFFIFIIVILFNTQFAKLLGNAQISLWLYFLPITLFFIGIFNILTMLNNREKNYAIISTATILKSVILVSSQLLIGFFKSGATGLISGQILSHLFANMGLAKGIIKDKAFFNTIKKEKMINLAKEHKNFAIFQTPHALINALSSNVPIYMFSSFFTMSVVGFYAFSLRIVFSPLSILSSSVAKVYNQKVVEAYHNGEDSYQLTKVLLIKVTKTMIVPFLIIIIFAPQIFAFVFGENWKEAGIYTQITSPFLFLNLLVSSISFIPSLVGKQKKALTVSIIHLIFSVLFILIGVYFKNIYLSLGLFTLVYSLILWYNLNWMLKELRVRCVAKKDIK